MEGPMAAWAKKLVGSADLKAIEEKEEKTQLDAFTTSYNKLKTIDKIKGWQRADETKLLYSDMDKNFNHYYLLYKSLPKEDKDIYFTVYLPTVFKNKLYTIANDEKIRTAATSTRPKRLGVDKALNDLAEIVDKEIKNPKYLKIAQQEKEYIINLEEAIVKSSNSTSITTNTMNLVPNENINNYNKNAAIGLLKIKEEVFTPNEREFFVNKLLSECPIQKQVNNVIAPVTTSYIAPNKTNNRKLNNTRLSGKKRKLEPNSNASPVVVEPIAKRARTIAKRKIGGRKTRKNKIN